MCNELIVTATMAQYTRIYHIPCYVMIMLCSVLLRTEQVIPSRLSNAKRDLTRTLPTTLFHPSPSKDRFLINVYSNYD